MRNGHSLDKSPHDKFIRVGETEFLWRVHRQPQWCTADGWKGLALYVELAREPQRALTLEFPFQVVSHRNSPHRQRPTMSEKDVALAIAAALTAGYDPESRGKPFVFQL